MQDEDDQIAQRLKVMQLLDCVAGRAMDPETGPPIAILTLGYRGEVEQPIMIDLRDVRKLTAECLCVLAEFEDETALEIHKRYVVSDQRRGGSVLLGDVKVVPQQDKPEADKNPTHETTGIFMTVRTGSRNRTQRYAILGGYRNGNETYVIVRNQSVPDQPEFVAKFGPKFTILVKPKGKNVLPQPLWPVFFDMAAGSQISIGGRLWTKLHHADLSHVIAGRIFTAKSNWR